MCCESGTKGTARAPGLGLDSAHENVSLRYRRACFMSRTHPALLGFFTHQLHQGAIVLGLPFYIFHADSLQTG